MKNKNLLKYLFLLFVTVVAPFNITVIAAPTLVFEGSINEKYPIHMELTIDKTIVEGQYYYIKYKQIIKITGTLDSAGNLRLIDSFKDKFDGQFDFNTSFNGKWIKSNGKKIFPFYLVQLKNSNDSNNDITFRLSQSIVFEGKEYAQIKKSELMDLSNKRLKLFTNDYGLKLITDEDLEFTVYTILDYRKALKADAYALNNLDMQRERYFQKVNMMFLLFSKAEIAKNTYFNNHDLADLQMISVKIIPGPSFFTSDSNIKDSDLKKDKSDNVSLDSYLLSDKLAILKKTKDELTAIYQKHTTVRLKEITKADFDNDGIEDMLVERGIGIVDGSLRWSDVLIFRLYDKSSKFIINGINQDLVFTSL
ncbi:hypothetical protein KKA14_21660 [bacterium]|nr:hypothetical protein [bacterium]